LFAYAALGKNKPFSDLFAYEALENKSFSDLFAYAALEKNKPFSDLFISSRSRISEQVRKRGLPPLLDVS
jgi:hypothetical protein